MAPQSSQRRSPKCWAGRNMDQTRAPIVHLKTSLRVVVETTATPSPRVPSASLTAVTATASPSSQIFSRASKASLISLLPCTSTKIRVWERKRNQPIWILRQSKSKTRISKCKKPRKWRRIATSKTKVKISWVVFRIYSLRRRMTNWTVTMQSMCVK